MDRLAIVSTVNTPLSQLQRNVSYHLALGVDEIILFCDNPFDEAFHFYAPHPNVTVVACSDEYWRQQVGDRPDSLPERQIVNVNEGAKLASARGCTWITHIDCDELIYSLADIKKVLAASKADVITYKLLEAVPEKDDYDHIFLPTLFRIRPRKWQIQASRALGCSDAFYCNEYLRGHKSSKVLVRLNSKVLKHGVHQPEACAADTVFTESNELTLLHYYSVGYSSWKEKYEIHINELKSGYNPEEWFAPSRQKQFQDYIKARSVGDKQLVALYRDVYMIPNRMRRVLFALGMLKTVDLGWR